MTDNPKVTAEKLASVMAIDIVNNCMSGSIYDYCLGRLMEATDSARAEALEEAALKDVRTADGAEVKKLDALASAYRLGHLEALEEAAKVIEGFTILDPVGAAVAIRSLMDRQC